jgi:hypothetical protein
VSRSFVTALLLVAQAATLGHLAFAPHTVCSDSGQLVEGAQSPDVVPQGDLVTRVASVGDEHCQVIDAALRPAVGFGGAPSLFSPVPVVPQLGEARAARSREPLSDAPKASPPAQG